MSLHTSTRRLRVGLVPRLALVPAIFAIMATTAGPGAQARVNRCSLKTVQVPNFVAAYLKNKLPGNTVAMSCYGNDQVAGVGKRNVKAQTQVVADFNGDGKLDWAGLVRSKEGAINLMVVYSKGQRHRHTLLQKDVGRSGYKLAVSVHLQKPGRIKEFPKSEGRRSKTVHLKRPGIEFIYFERSSVVFYWKKRQFAALWTSD